MIRIVSHVYDIHNILAYEPTSNGYAYVCFECDSHSNIHISRHYDYIQLVSIGDLPLYINWHTTSHYEALLSTL